MRVTYDAEADAVYIYLVEIASGDVERGSIIDRKMNNGAVLADSSETDNLLALRS
jgi:uncharacterized protein YuzE